MKKYLCPALYLLFLFPLAASAEVYSCNGVWTNRPCPESGIQPPPPSVSVPEDNQEAKIRSQKRSLFHELTMKSIKAKREYNLSYDLSGLEELCFKSPAPFSECEAKIQMASDRIEERMASLEMVRAQKKANELQEQRNKVAANQPQTQVNISQDKYVVVNPRGRHDHYRGRRDYVTESRGSASVQGTFRGNNVTVQAEGSTGAASRHPGYGRPPGPVYPPGRQQVRPDHNRPPHSRPPAQQNRKNKKEEPEDSEKPAKEKNRSYLKAG